MLSYTPDRIIIIKNMVENKIKEWVIYDSKMHFFHRIKIK